MTEPQWRYHTPERDGHAPDDWVEGMEWDYVEVIDDPEISGHLRSKPCWWAGTRYCYRPLQDATYEPSSPSLLAQCLALPQDQREALIEAMQKPTLLPCPFCGNDGRGPIEEALHVCHSEQEEHVNYDCYNVQCDRCTATMGYSESEEKAIEAWNTRIQDGLEVLRKVRGCALVSENTFADRPPSVSWIVSQLTKLLPDIDAALAERETYFLKVDAS